MQHLGPNDPQRVGPYRLTHVLGSGGMGRVYLGRTPSGRRVAVKVVHAEHMRNAEFRARFVREVQAARRVGGFHTAQVVDADTEAEQPWIASAYIPGPSVSAVVDRHGPLPEPSLRVLAAGLAEGLLAIHRADLAHRDLKPGNILVDREGPRIIDFGIALPAEDDQITRTGTVLGTPAYMSPEQAFDDPDLLGPASDVFAFGTVLHYAATGANPFQAQTVMASLARLLTTDPEVSSDLPPDLAEIVGRCWRRDPAQRPDLTEVLHAMDGVDPDTAWPPYADPTPGPAPDEQRTVVRAQPVARVPRTLVVTKQLAKNGPDPTRHAESLLRRAKEFRELKLHDKALALTEEAIALRRPLADQDPDAHLHLLDKNLLDHGIQLMALDRDEEALPFLTEAVSRCRQLVARDAWTHTPDLAHTLAVRSNCLSQLDRPEEALPLLDEAIRLRRRIDAARENPHPRTLANYLHVQSSRLRKLRRNEEAVPCTMEAVALMRPMGAADPLRHGPYLVSVLRHQAHLLHAVGRRQEAVAAAAEAVQVGEELVRRDSDAHSRALGSARRTRALVTGTRS